MRIGMIGAGAVALAIAKQSLQQGHDVVLSNRRGRTRAIDAIDGVEGALGLGSLEDAASQEVVLLAVPWLQVKDVLSKVQDWGGRVLIDATNPFTQIEPTLELADLGDDTASEIVARHAPGARVVKAFNSIYISRFEGGPRRPGGRRILFVSGNDAEAKRTVSALIDSFGFAVVDLGDLRHGGRLQQAGSALAGRDFLVAD